MIEIEIQTDAHSIDICRSINVLWGSHLPHTLELHPAELHAERRDPVDVHLLLIGAAQDVERFVHDLHLLLVVNGLNGDFAEADERVVMNLQDFIDLSIELPVDSRHH